MGLLHNLPAAESKDLEAERAQLIVAGAILSGRELAAVKPFTVGFDHEPLASPEEIDQIWADANIDLGLGKTPTPNQV
ncbi:MAG: hypothetical protein K0R88_35 [Solirubrobacterales bacterium]|nr:hypothetical protein [Solirubrobacterales bacterium]